jgi:hypothetical protein
MTDLNQRLVETFERRAALAPAVVSPEAVRQAARRQRVRTAKLSAAGLAAWVVLATGLVATLQHTGRSTAPAVTPPSWQPGIVVASIPWTGGYTLSIRYGEGVGSAELEFCIANANPSYSCTGPVQLSGDTIDNLSAQGEVYGTAPTGTSKVLVTVDGQKPAAALLAKFNLDQRGLPAADGADPVLFGVPGLSSSVGLSGLISRTVHVEALDAAGAVIATRTALGSWDLAQAHPPAGAVGQLPGPKPSTGLPQKLLWISADGWSCTGEAATVDDRQQYGADSCTQPFAVGSVGLLNSTSSDKLRTYILRMPASVATAVLVTHNGRQSVATITRGPYGNLAVVTEDNTVPNDPATLTARDSNDQVVYRGDIDKLPGPENVSTVTSG